MRKFILSLVALVGLSTAAALGNYALTQGSGTNFGSIVVSTVHYAQQLVCDPTTPAQCAVVDASGILTVKGTVTATPTGTQAVSIASGQVASGAFASGALALGSVASGAMVDLGAQADSARKHGNFY